jgi:WbqC-like protein family
MLEAAYSEAGKLERLSEINLLFLTRISEALGVTTPFAYTTSVPHNAASPTARLVEICKGRHATIYVSGPAAKSYIDRALFEDAGVGLRYVSYAGYPAYDQNSPTFEHGVSMLDVLVRFGPAARDHLKSAQDRERLLEPT